MCSGLLYLNMEVVHWSNSIEFYTGKWSETGRLQHLLLKSRQPSQLSKQARPKQVPVEPRKDKRYRNKHQYATPYLKQRLGLVAKIARWHMLLR